MTAKILCIEDDKYLRELMLAELSLSGYDVTVAVNGKEGLTHILENRPNLILSDISMPVMSGIELLQQIKTNYPDLSDIPLIFLSALADRESVIDGRRLGCDDYVTKPVDFELLDAIIKSRLESISRIEKKEKAKNINLTQSLSKDLWRSKWMQSHDSVTGLPTKKTFIDRLRARVKKAHNSTHSPSLLLIEVNILARLGELATDNVLDVLAQTTATRLRKCIREIRPSSHMPSNTNWIARLGLNRFALVLIDGGDDEELLAIASSVSESISSPIFSSDDKFLISSAIGIARASKDDVEELLLVRNAETALLKAKLAKQNNCKIFEPGWGPALQRERKLDRDLLKALEKSEFLLHYQPRVDATCEKIIGVEALVRWQHLEYGCVRPDEFISLAESNGLIIPIGEWILRTACKQAVAWQKADLRPIEIAVNISSLQFQQHDLPDVISRILDDVGLNPKYLEVEITESMFMENTDTVLRNLNRIHDLGVGIAIDDFGTGYSSLAYLKRFPASTIKIDRTFVSGALSNTADSAIAEAVTEIGHANNMIIVAEGVETREQVDYLKYISCDQLQGYYFSPPIPPAEITALVTSP